MHIQMNTLHLCTEYYQLQSTIEVKFYTINYPVLLIIIYLIYNISKEKLLYVNGSQRF